MWRELLWEVYCWVSCSVCLPAFSVLWTCFPGTIHKFSLKQIESYHRDIGHQQNSLFLALFLQYIILSVSHLLLLLLSFLQCFMAHDVDFCTEERGTYRHVYKPLKPWCVLTWLPATVEVCCLCSPNVLVHQILPCTLFTCTHNSTLDLHQNEELLSSWICLQRGAQGNVVIIVPFIAIALS